MAYVMTDDDVRLHVEERGEGDPLLFIHEFAGDSRSWEPQLSHFSSRYRCIAYDARGYAPSDVPDHVGAYSQARAVADAIAVLDGLGIRTAHVVGLSMGGFCALHLALRHPGRVRSLVVAGVGYGAHPDDRERFRRESAAVAAAFRAEGAAEVAKRYAVGPARVQLQNKNPAAWSEFATALGGHSPVGAALTMLGVQSRRPSLYDLSGDLAALAVPTLIVAGDEDDGCLETGLMLKRTIPTSGLALLPRTGHTCNLEEPERFNDALEHFLAAVAAGRWTARDPRSLSASMTGMDESFEDPPSSAVP